jgi:hypothetical protein
MTLAPDVSESKLLDQAPSGLFVLKYAIEALVEELSAVRRRGGGRQPNERQEQAPNEIASVVCLFECPELLCPQGRTMHSQR